MIFLKESYDEKTVNFAPELTLRLYGAAALSHLTRAKILILEE